MNYIMNLQATVKGQTEVLAKTISEIDLFIEFLHGPKFQGQESDGGRKDWISTADVISRLQEIKGIQFKI